MGNQEVISKLNCKLADNINEWLESIVEEDEWTSLHIYCGENLGYLMAKSAMSVLEGTIDIQKYMKEENLINRDAKLS